MDSGKANLPTDLSMVDLVRRVASGDRGAEDLLFNSYYRMVRAMVARRCPPRDPSVEDLTQEVLTTVLVHLRNGVLKEAAAFPGYLQTCIVRMTSSEQRRVRNRPDAQELSDAAPDAARTPEAVASRDALNAAVRSLVQELPVQRDRELLQAFYLREEDVVVVSSRHQLDEVHFRRVLHRARRRFRALLLDHGAEWTGNEH